LTLALDTIRLEVNTGEEQTTPQSSPSQGEGALSSPLSHSVGEGLGVKASRGEVRPSEVPNVLFLTPIGVPFEGPGGKGLVEGEHLRIAQHPDAETGQLAFACAVVFRISKEESEGLLHVPSFPPVAVLWGSGENREKSQKESATGTANGLETLPG